VNADWTVEEMLQILCDVERRMTTDDTVNGFEAFQAYFDFMDDFVAETEAA
jgi:hypothetical protein